MSSFDAMGSAPGPKVGGPDFEPLSPALKSGEGGGSTWRPLFGAAAREAGLAGEAERSVDEMVPAQPTEPETVAAGSESARAFAAGYELGRQEARAEVEVVAESLVKSMEELAEFRAGLRQRYEHELLELALGVARKILHAEVGARPEIWLGVIREAVRGVVDREEVRIRVPSVLATYLRERLPEMRAQLDEVREFGIIEDPTLPPSGCIIETQFSELDVGIDTQVDQVERALTRVG